MKEGEDELYTYRMIIYMQIACLQFFNNYIHKIWKQTEEINTGIVNQVIMKTQINEGRNIISSINEIV